MRRSVGFLTRSAIWVVALAFGVLMLPGQALAGDPPSQTRPTDGSNVVSLGKIEAPSVWEKSTEKVLYQGQDGSVQQAADQTTQDGFSPNVKVWGSEGSVGDAVWNPEWTSDAGDRFAIKVLGADAEYEAMAGIVDGNITAKFTGEASVTLIGIEGNTRTVGLGDENLGIQIHGEGEAKIYAGVEGEGTFNIGKDGAELSGSIEAFAGGKAEGSIPIQAMLCGLSAGASLNGEVSYGIGAGAEATFKFDWENLTLTMNAEAAATVGLGAGAGVEVTIDLSALVKDPGAVGECLKQKLVELGKMAAELGATMVEAAEVVIDKAAEVAGAAIDTAVEGVKTAANAVGDALDSAGSAIASGWNSFTSWLSGGDDGC